MGTREKQSKGKRGRSTKRALISDVITRSQLKRLEASLLAEVRRLERCRKNIARIDKEVFQVGISCFESTAALAHWLTEPAIGLGGKVPLQVMRTGKGRKDVANLLRRIEYGVY